MSTFKEYARRAKERMKNGFWENAKQDLQREREVAATLGLNERQVTYEQHQKLQKQIYNYDGFCEDEEFFHKVSLILSGNEVISNPIMRLADQEYMATLSPKEQQVYIAKLAARYRAAVEKYNALHNS